MLSYIFAKQSCCVCFIYHLPSIHFLYRLIRRSGRGGAGAYPSDHRAKGGVHPGQVASLINHLELKNLLISDKKMIMKTTSLTFGNKVWTARGFSCKELKKYSKEKKKQHTVEEKTF